MSVSPLCDIHQYSTEDAENRSLFGPGVPYWCKCVWTPNAFETEYVFLPTTFFVYLNTSSDISPNELPLPFEFRVSDATSHNFAPSKRL